MKIFGLIWGTLLSVVVPFAALAANSSDQGTASISISMHSTTNTADSHSSLSRSASLSSSPYTIEVPVVDYSDAERDKAFANAFKQMLTNLGGDATAANQQDVKAALKNIPAWVKSYSYTKHAGSSSAPTLSLVINFYPKSVPRKLKRAAVSTANEASVDDNHARDVSSQDSSSVMDIKSDASSTPSSPSSSSSSTALKPLLMWLVILDPKQTPTHTLVLDDSNNNLGMALKEAAKSEKINLMLPAMDIEDMTAITPDDICNLDLDTIKKAAKRYATKAIAAGCISNSHMGKQSFWLLANAGKSYQWHFMGDTDMEVIDQALGVIADTLLASKATSSNNEAVNSSQKMKNDNGNANEDENVDDAAKADAVSDTAASASKPQDAAVTENKAAAEIAKPAEAAKTVAEGAAATTTIATSSVEIGADNSSKADDSSSPSEEAASAPSAAQDVRLDPNHAIVHIKNITNLDQYASAVKYLRSFSAINKVELLNISSSVVKLDITIEGGQRALVKALKGQRTLIFMGPKPKPLKSSSTTVIPDPDKTAYPLTYLWSPSQ